MLFYFAFLCGFVMLSIFSCTCWPSVCFLCRQQKNVYSGLLPIFKQGCLFFILSCMSYLYSLDINLLLVILCVCVQLLQSRVTLSDSVDCSSSGTFLQGILQARIIWSGLPCPPPGDLPDPGIEHVSLMSPALAVGFMQ